MVEAHRLLAPNGEPSSLPEPLYDYVRTPGFKASYGDWEHGEGRVPLDANGEPLVLWHGSANSFESFDFSRAGENTGLVEYTDRRTGEKVTSDSCKAMFFTDNRELAISYAFLAKTQEYGEMSSSLSDCISLLRLSALVNKRIKTVDDFRNFVRSVRRGDDEELIAAFSGFDVDVDHPLSRLDESVREDIRERLIEVRSRYSRLYEANRSGGLSNQLNNYVRQSEYFRYFVENFDRVCSNDFTVQSEFGDDLTSHSVSFFSPDGHFGLSFHAEDARIALYGYGEGKVYVDSLTAQERLDVLGRIRDDLNAGIRNLNEKLRSSGYADAVHLYPVFLQVGNPLVHDYQGSSFPDKYRPNEKYDTAYIAARQVRRAVEQGNDAVVYRNIRDPFDGTSYGVFSGSQIEMLRGRELGLNVLPYLNELPLNSIYMAQNEKIQTPEGMRELTKDEMAQTVGGVEVSPFSDKLIGIAQDLAIRFTGGGYLEKNDIALSLYEAGLKTEQLLEFRDYIRKLPQCEFPYEAEIEMRLNVGEERMLHGLSDSFDPAIESLEDQREAHIDFIEKELKEWLPDDVLERGEYFSKNTEFRRAAENMGYEMHVGYDLDDIHSYARFLYKSGIKEEQLPALREFVKKWYEDDLAAGPVDTTIKDLIPDDVLDKGEILSNLEKLNERNVEANKEGMKELSMDEMSQTVGGAAVPENAYAEGEQSPAPMYFLDREWFDVNTGQLMGDMQWSLEEADNYRSASPGRLRDIAVNLSLADMQFQDAEGLIPVYHVRNEDESGAVHVVVACHDIPEELKALLSYVEEAEIEAVAAEQEAIEIKEDAESKAREEEQQRRQEAVNHLAEACLGLAVMAELHFSPLEIMGRSFDSMTWHEGRDGDVYYCLSSSETMERTPGMALFRLQDFMCRADLSSLERAASEVLGAAPREEINYVESEGESIARGASDILEKDGLSFRGTINGEIPFGISQDHLFFVEGGVDHEFVMGDREKAGLEAASGEGLLYEVVMSAVNELREDPELSVGVALARGLREWDIDIPLAMGRGR